MDSAIDPFNDWGLVFRYMTWCKYPIAIFQRTTRAYPEFGSLKHLRIATLRCQVSGPSQGRNQDPSPPYLLSSLWI